MASDGGNQYLKAHNGGREKRKITGTSVDLTVNKANQLKVARGSRSVFHTILIFVSCFFFIIKLRGRLLVYSQNN